MGPCNITVKTIGDHLAYCAVSAFRNAKGRPQLVFLKYLRMVLPFLPPLQLRLGPQRAELVAEM